MNSPKDETIAFQIEKDGIAVLRVNRRHARNALNWKAQDHFVACIESLKNDDRVRSLIITGSGHEAFVSGGDLKEILQHHDPSSGRRLNRGMGQALAQLGKLPFPVIAAINGDAYGGGCEIITACDLRIAGEQTWFSFAQVRNGLTTGWGGTGRLVQLIGLSRACDLLLTGRLFDAHEAYQAGLLHRLVPAGQDVLSAAREWAGELIKLPAGAQAALKELLYASASLPTAEVQKLETLLFMKQWGSPDHLESLAAFTDKRPPVFNQLRDQ